MPRFEDGVPSHGNRERFALSPAFWAHFEREHWEKRPLLIKNPFAEPILSPEATFKTLVRASQRAGSTDDLPIGFYVDYGRLIAEVRKYLPLAADGSNRGYAERLSRALQGRRFALIAQEFQAENALLWFRLREFVRGLFAVVGVPGQGAKATLFMGDYEKTPVGLHDGNSSNFKFIIEGRKKMRLWPGEFFRGKEEVERTLDYERFADGGVTLEGEPGDIIYWPSSNWHIGEPVDGLAVSISLALFVHDQPSAPHEIWAQLARRIEESIGTTAIGDHDLFNPKQLPPRKRTVTAVANLAARHLRESSRDPELGEQIDAMWLNRATSFGFEFVPPPLPPKSLGDDAVVQGSAEYPIAWLPASDDEMICSVNGHSFSIAANPNIIALFKKLNRAGSHRVRDLLDDFAGTIVRREVEFGATREEIRALLEKLCGLRALIVNGAIAEDT